MKPPGYLYCFQFAGTDIGKVGHTGTPEFRLKRFAGFTPYKIEIVRVLKLRTQEEAAAWERVVLTGCNLHREHGEWVRMDDVLTGLLASVLPSEDVTAAYAIGESGRRVPKEPGRDPFTYLASARAKAAAGPGAKIDRDISGDADHGERRAIIRECLRQGYGAEDAQFQHGIPAADFRAEVAQLRAAGKLADVLGLPSSGATFRARADRGLRKPSSISAPARH